MATDQQVIPAPVVAGRKLDWFPRFDEASRRFAAAPGVTAMPPRGRLWQPGRVLDQGAEGACCGFAAAAEAAGEPVRVPRIGNAYARGWYLGARRRDEWPGEQYDGTSVLGTMKEGRARGLFLRFVWHFSAEQLAHGIVRDEDEDGGPAVVGVEWRQGSYQTDQLGVLRPSGDVVGGHALDLFGVVVPADLTATDAAGRQLLEDLEELDLLDAVRAVLEDDGEDAAYLGQNSWGTGYGRGGRFVVAASTVRGWFAARGEFAQPQQRQLPARRGTTAVAEPEQEQGEQQPEEQDGDDVGTSTLHVTLADVLERDRILDPPEELGRESVTVRALPQLVSGRRARVLTTAGTITLAAATPVTVRRPQQ